MKVLNIILTMIILLTCFASCSYDNYKEPESFLKGQIVYQGDPIGVSVTDVSFELWEPGWQKRTPIDVAVDQDGSFSAKLFNAEYKLIIPSFQGPFKMLINEETGSDTIIVNLNGNKDLDIEVLPYYMIRNTEFSVEDNIITATFKAEQIISGSDARSIDRVYLYINKTMFVDYRWNISSAQIGGRYVTNPDSVLMKVKVPDMVPVQTYVFARVGLKIMGVEDMIFSDIQKVNL
ncbi:DUF3823 domain-containing protein [Saccharicrinis sp. FJH62]|uniref:DUF3823 domain-containing protein n=1 Tax=Saccharicrinis sp. FJH62 TaxID=3344657 RepID=UPI0035D50035